MTKGSPVREGLVGGEGRLLAVESGELLAPPDKGITRLKQSPTDLSGTLLSLTEKDHSSESPTPLIRKTP